MSKDKLSIKELMEFMKKNGLTVNEFALILGVTPQAVTLWLKGGRDISLTTTRVIKIMKKYPQILKEFEKC